MPPAIHPGRLLRRELEARNLSVSRLAAEIGVPASRIRDIVNERRAISTDTAYRLGLYFGNSPRFWLDLQTQYNLARLEERKGKEIAARVRPARAV